MKDKHGSVVGRYNVNSDRMLQCTSLLRSLLRQRERKARYYNIAIGILRDFDYAIKIFDNHKYEIYKDE